MISESMPYRSTSDQPTTLTTGSGRVRLDTQHPVRGLRTGEGGTKRERELESQFEGGRCGIIPLLSGLSGVLGVCPIRKAATEQNQIEIES